MGLKPELKYFDTIETVPQNIKIAGSTWFNSINLVPESVSPNGMIGRKIVIRRITLRAIITKTPSVSVAVTGLEPVDYVKFLLIQDKQANGGSPSIADVFSQANSRGFMNLANSKRFKVIKSWEMNLNTVFNSYWNSTTATANFQSGTVARTVDWSKKVYIPIEFNPNGAATRPITDVKSNNLFIMGFNSSVNDACTYTLAVRIRYEDN